MKFIRLLGAVLITSIVGLLVITGCSSTSAQSSPTVTSTAPATTIQPSASPASYTDDIGRTVRIKGIPRTIISLSPSNTEMVYALGLQDKLIGVTTYDNYPPEVKDKPAVSDYSTIDVEKIVSLNPDLVLASDIQKTDAIPALEKVGLTVFTISPQNMDGIFRDLQFLGQITGKTQEANTLVSGLQARIKAITDKTSGLPDVQKNRVLYVTWHDPIWTAGGDTLINDLINKAGGINIAADMKGYATITLESVIERNPQEILVMSSMGDQNTSLNYIKAEPRFQATDALKNNHVDLIDADIFGRTSPRIVDGLEQITKLMHPELFK